MHLKIVFQSMKEHYLTLNLNNIVNSPIVEQKLRCHRKSLRRSWRELLRSQKILVALGFCLTILIFLWIAKLQKFSLQDVKNVKNETILLPNSFMDKDLGENILKKAKPYAEIGENTVFPRPIGFRQNAIVRAVKHAWKGYKKYAWGHDHLRPIAGNFEDSFMMGLTIVDSLDTLLMMNLNEEYEEAREWVNSSLNFNCDCDVNLFETTIRVMGGLLAAYHFTRDNMYVQKAALLGKKLLPSFSESSTAIPYSDVNLNSGKAHSPIWYPYSSLSEVSSVQLEFRDLSRISGDSEYERVAAKVSEHIHGLSKPDGLAPVFISPLDGQFDYSADIKIGARGDSYYEYLLKQWIQTGKKVDYLKNDYIEAIEGIWKRLAKETPKRNLTFIGELLSISRHFKSSMDHVTCFLPGTLALGVHHGMPKEHLHLAIALTETCYFMYADQPTSISPEIAYFNYDGRESSPDMYVLANDAHYLLRPEFAESLWYMHRITGNATYQTWGWKVFQAIERYTKVPNGYTTINNVLDPQNVYPRDKMETFFLSETLKYLYLLLSPNQDIIDIDKYVMNTEGHPLPVYESY